MRNGRDTSATRDFEATTGQSADATGLLFRVFDAYVRQLLEDSPPLLGQEEIDALRNGIAREAPDRLDPTDSERLDATIAAALGRLRTHSRLDILDDHLRKTLGLEVERSMLKRIDRRRGHLAHNPAEHDEQSPEDSEADSHLFSIVHAIIKHRLGL